ncbi:MAG: zinc ribbon domain-containing protein [Ruminococcaceae bacterium]|nr:zinc ribbon domain-containing protein [Oscillospiraceae bacterium]
MKYCVNCGNAMNDTDIICQNCGANNAPAQPQNTTEKKLPDLKKIPPKFIGIAAVAVVAIVALIIIISAFSGGGYNKAIDNLIDVSMYGKIDKIEKLAPKEFWDMVKDEEDLSVKKFIDAIEDAEIVEEMIESMEDEFGKNVKVTYKVTEEEELDKDDLKELKEHLKETYDVSKKDVKKAYELELEMKIKGSEDKDEDETDLVVVKIGNNWYPLVDGEFYPSMYLMLVAFDSAGDMWE